MQNKYLLEQSLHFHNGLFEINSLINITKVILNFFQISNILERWKERNSNYKENKDKDMRYQKRLKFTWKMNFPLVTSSRIYIYISILKKGFPPKDRFSSSRVIQFRSTIDSRWSSSTLGESTVYFPLCGFPSRAACSLIKGTS